MHFIVMIGISMIYCLQTAGEHVALHKAFAYTESKVQVASVVMLAHLLLTRVAVQVPSACTAMSLSSSERGWANIDSITHRWFDFSVLRALQCLLLNEVSLNCMIGNSS